MTPEDLASCQRLRLQIAAFCEEMNAPSPCFYGENYEVR